MQKPTLSVDRQHARAENAVAQFLFNHLVVPKIFLEASWRGTSVDVLAVDRSGTGDIHVVEVKVGNVLPDLARTVHRLQEIPAHFKYLALLENRNYRPDESLLYAPDGIGRVGVIQVMEDNAGDLSAGFLLRPERFRLDSSHVRMMDRFVAKHPADFEIRP